MAIETFVTKYKARLYTKTGTETKLYVPAGTVLDCNWQWTTGTLSGMRKIEVADNPGFVGYYIQSVDLRVYTPPTEPEPEPGNYIAEHTVRVVINGETWECWYPKTPLERVG